MPAIIVVNKFDIINDSIISDADALCQKVNNGDYYISFHPKPTSIVPLVVMLSERGISFSINFDGV